MPLSLRSYQSRFTLIFLLAIPLLVIAVNYGMPLEDRGALVLLLHHINWFNFWTYTFVHYDSTSALVSVSLYLIAVLPTWFLFNRRGRDKRLGEILLIYFLVFPPLLAILDMVFYLYVLDLGTTKIAINGFTGIIAAVFGLLFSTILDILWDRLGKFGAIGVGSATILSIQAKILADAGALTTPVLLVIVSGVLLSLSISVPEGMWGEPRKKFESILGDWPTAALIIYGLAVLVFITPGLFPIEWVSGDSFTNIFGHLLAWGFGFIGGAVTAFLLSPRGQIELRKRSHLHRVYWSRVAGGFHSRKGLITLIAPIGFAFLGYNYSSSNSILVGATVLYASLLLFREFPPQPALIFTSLKQGTTTTNTGEKLLITARIRNSGNAPAERVILNGRIVDPIAGESTEWETGEFTVDPYEVTTNTENSIDIPSHHYGFGYVYFEMDNLEDWAFSESMRLEMKIECVTQSFVTYGVISGDITGSDIDIPDNDIDQVI